MPGFKPKITLIGPLDSAIPAELNDDALATLRESLSNVVRNAEADAGACVSRGGHEAKRLTIQVEGNWLGIDPHVTPGGRNTAARARASGGRTTVVRRSEPGGPPSPRLRESGSRSPMLPRASPADCAHFQRGGHGRTDFGPDPVDCRPSDPPESASATVGAATWPRRLIMRMLRTNRTAVGSGVR